MPAVRPNRKTELDQYSPYPSSTAKQEGEEIGQAAATLLGMKSATLTPEEIAEFESAVDEEFAKFTTGGRRKKMRGGDVPEVISKSKELWSAILKTMATPENAGIAIVATTVGIASPTLVHSAFSVARAALNIASQAVTPETVAFTSCAALVYYYFGDKVFPKGQTITEDIAIQRMNNAIETAKKTRRGSETLRVVIDKFKEDLDKSKSVTNWEATEDEALEVQKRIKENTGPSKIGVNQLSRIDVGKPLGNVPPPSQVNTTSQGLPPAPAKSTGTTASIFSATSQPTDTKSRWSKGGSRRRTKRHHRHRLSAPTRKRRSSSARHRGDTR
jgi:hypothetical protein